MINIPVPTLTTSNFDKYILMEILRRSLNNGFLWEKYGVDHSVIFLALLDRHHISVAVTFNTLIIVSFNARFSNWSALTSVNKWCYLISTFIICRFLVLLSTFSITYYLIQRYMKLFYRYGTNFFYMFISSLLVFYRMLTKSWEGGLVGGWQHYLHPP